MMLEVLGYLKYRKIMPSCQIMYMWLLAQNGFGIEFSMPLVQIKELTGVSVSSIKKYTNQLAELGMIKKDRQYAGRKYLRTQYIILPMEYSKNATA